MNILYIADGFGTVYMSQVHNLCNAHSVNNNVKVLSFCKYEDRNKKIAERDYDLINVVRPPAFFIPVVAKLVSTMFNKKELIEWADVIHCRGHGSALVSFFLQDRYKIYKPTIVDIRGAIAEEIRYAKKSFINNYIADQVLKAEQIIFKRANRLFFVSKNMHEYYSKKYEQATNNFNIFPTIVNEKYFHLMPESRQKTRKQLNIEGTYTYVYSGGNSSWQNIDKILLKFSEKALSHNIHLVMLILNTKAVTKLIKKLGVNPQNITIMSLKYENVGKYLNACDAGLIIRDNSIVNYVASPTKINEYLACGLHIVDNLEEIGNTSYNAIYWQDNYMSLEAAVNKQRSIYKSLLNTLVSKEKI